MSPDIKVGIQSILNPQPGAVSFTLAPDTLIFLIVCGTVLIGSHFVLK